MPRRPNKVEPIERFPAKPRKDGRFQKRIHGVVHYFGRDGDRAVARAEYDRVKHALYEGSRPVVRSGGENLTLKQLTGLHSLDRKAEADAGRLTHGWYVQHKRALARFVKFFGGTTLVSTLRPEDFAAYGRHLQSKLGDYAYNRERASIVSMFNHAEECDWIDRAPKLGRGFKKVGASVMRQQRDVKSLDFDVVKAVLCAAPPKLWTMFYLGLIGGYGPGDCLHLEWSHVDIDKQWIRFRRPKTNVKRDTHLTREAVDALTHLRGDGPAEGLVFRTKYGKPWTNTAVAHETQKLVAAINQKRAKHNLKPISMTPYDFRHTFATVSAETGLSDARRRMMGRILVGLDESYVHAILPGQIRNVGQYVHDRVLCFREGFMASSISASAATKAADR